MLCPGMKIGSFKSNDLVRCDSEAGVCHCTLHLMKRLCLGMENATTARKGPLI